jgi:hypothetical protein
MHCILVFGKLKLRKSNKITLCYTLDYFQIKQLSKLGLHASNPLNFEHFEQVCKQVADIFTQRQVKNY